MFIMHYKVTTWNIDLKTHTSFYIKYIFGEQGRYTFSPVLYLWKPSSA